MKKILKILGSLILIICLFILIHNFVTRKNNIEILVQEIKSGFSGKITDKYAVRNTPPTHLKIKTENEILEISPNSEIVKIAEIGDSIIKPKNENWVYIKKSNGDRLKLFYTRISFETRKNENFPKKWKNRWLESSRWDK